MEPQIIPLNGSIVNLHNFVQIVGKDKLNEIDGKAIPPAAKFADLVDISLYGEIKLALKVGYDHIYQSFYFKLPAKVEMGFRQFAQYNQFNITCHYEGMLVEGIISGSLTLWNQFVNWLKQSEELTVFATVFNLYFKFNLNNDYRKLGISSFDLRK